VRVGSPGQRAHGPSPVLNQRALVRVVALVGRDDTWAKGEGEAAEEGFKGLRIKGFQPTPWGRGLAGRRQLHWPNSPKRPCCWLSPAKPIASPAMVFAVTPPAASMRSLSPSTTWPLKTKPESLVLRSSAGGGQGEGGGNPTRWSA